MFKLRKIEKLKSNELIMEIPRTSPGFGQSQIADNDATAFNLLIGTAIVDTYREGRISKLTKHIFETQVLDPVTKEYIGSVIKALGQNLEYPQVRENLKNMHYMLFNSNNGKAFALTDRLHKDHNKCLDWRVLVECCVNPKFNFENSNICNILLKEANNLDNYLSKDFVF